VFATKAILLFEGIGQQPLFIFDLFNLTGSKVLFIRIEGPGLPVSKCSPAILIAKTAGLPIGDLFFPGPAGEIRGVIVKPDDLLPQEIG